MHQTPRLARTAVVLLALALTTAACGGPSTAEGADDAPYYEGATIELIAPVGPGGTVDGVARLFASHLSEHIEGNPTVQVNNIEGGSGILAGNEFANSREADGNTLMLVTQVSLLPAILGDAAAEYDLAEFRPLWAANRGQYTMLFAPSTGVTEAADLSSPEGPLVMGSIGPAGADLPVVVGFEVLGLYDQGLEVVVGYENGEALENAFAAGELTILREGSPNYLESYADQYPPVYTHGQIDDDGDLVRDEVVPDAPHLGEVHEVLHGEPPSGEAWEAFKMLVDVLGRGGYSLQTHQDAPPEALEALDAAVASVLEDEEFNEQLIAFMGPAPGSLAGERAVSWGDGVADLDPELVTWVQTFLSERFGLEFGQ